ncbi:ADP-ribosyl cyclase/cyclic ADP-ribose hydrolase 1-like [Saccopteryx bilineata]|uniref:ADP-ribosyl cyclase/cyclic ADP-ribose hydrolase 1-like n=1 Tax=Saccopteryx bilineata TaxID=59482 RepID=UPI00338DD201
MYFQSLLVQEAGARGTLKMGAGKEDKEWQKKDHKGEERFQKGAAFSTLPPQPPVGPLLELPRDRPCMKPMPMPNHRFSPLPRVESHSKLSLSTKRKVCLGITILCVVLAVTAVMVVVLRAQAPKHKEWNEAGSTSHFSEIVLGRCYTYTQVLRPELRHKNCQKIWKAFMNAFLSKDPCDSTEQDYQPLMELTNQSVPCHKTVLWSKSSELAHQYTGILRDMFTLEDTLLGYMADGLTWCGDKGSSEMNYQSCPLVGKNCTRNAITVFWAIVSKRFVENACGEVQVVLNGSISNTFDKNSTFGLVEIHHLNPLRVPKLQAWVMHDLDGAHSHSCSSPSINDLKLILNRRNITFTCQDDYWPIKLLQCVKSSEHALCSSAA